MTWLVYINDPRGPSARVIFDGENGPVLSETERKAGVLAKFPLRAGEERLPIAELTERYPWPPAPPPGEDPAPISPAPEKPRDVGGVARELEVA